LSQQFALSLQETHKYNEICDLHSIEDQRYSILGWKAVHSCVCVCVRVHACVCINILKQPYSSTPSVATQWLDMQLLVIARPLGLMELIIQSPNVLSETLRTTKRPDKRQQLCPVTE